jgi:hypothetical protein
LDDVKLTPGNGFHLGPDGQWKVEKIPDVVLKNAQFSGYLTIQGHRSTVFDTPDGDQWAQKSIVSCRRDTSMTPNQLVAALRQVAAKIDNSKNPDKNLVTKELTTILAAITAEQQQTSEQQQTAEQQQQALPQSNTGKGALKRYLKDAEAAVDSGDEAAFKAAIDKLMKLAN